MYEHKTQIRVRYAEADPMNVVYYGNYAQYFEVGRVESLRALGISGELASVRRPERPSIRMLLP